MHTVIQCKEEGGSRSKEQGEAYGSSRWQGHDLGLGDALHPLQVKGGGLC